MLQFSKPYKPGEPAPQFKFTREELACASARYSVPRVQDIIDAHCLAGWTVWIAMLNEGESR